MARENTPRHRLYKQIGVEMRRLLWGLGRQLVGAATVWVCIVATLPDNPLRQSDHPHSTAPQMVASGAHHSSVATPKP
jgi:hypothetical protein